MSYQPDRDAQDPTAGYQGDGSEGGEDLQSALSGGGEMNFVSETKQPMSRGTMVVGGLLLACGAFTYFMYIRTGPSTAEANPESVKAQTTIQQMLNSGGAPAKALDDLIKKTEGVVAEFRRAEDVVQIPLSQLQTNPFKRGGGGPRVGDATDKAARELEAYQEAVKEIKLQTIVHRDPKKATAMINKMLYRKGGRILMNEGKLTFIVEQIDPDMVTVSATTSDGKSHKFELKMKQ